MVAGDGASWGRRTKAFPDSPLLRRDVYVTCPRCLEVTESVMVMTGVTNPVSRDRSIRRFALDSSGSCPRRVMWGIGTGDGAAWGAGLKPGSVRQLREYILAVKGLISGERVSFWWAHVPNATNVASTSEPVPIIVACAGPRVLRMAAQSLTE